MGMTISERVEMLGAEELLVEDTAEAEDGAAEEEAEGGAVAELRENKPLAPNGAENGVSVSSRSEERERARC